MYYRYFGLKEAPFSIAVNPRYLFMSARHRDALAHLLYGVGVGGGFILLTGEVGTGKTTINRCLLEQIPANTDIALILNPSLNAIELLATVCDELGIEYQPGEQSLKVLTDKLHQFLLANHADGRNTVLLIDEAQHLKFDVLEQVRLLTNLETNTQKLLQIILVGQPELRALLNKPELRQLAQRITARYQLKPLNLTETDAYIRHRLQVAGLPAGQQLFSKSIVKSIHKISRGVPRIINVLCDRMLLGTYGQNKTHVDKAMLKQATQEVMGEEEDLQLQAPANTTAVIAITVTLLIAAALWWQWPRQSDSMTSATATAPAVAAAPVTNPPATAAIEPNSRPTAPAANNQPSASPSMDSPSMDIHSSSSVPSIIPSPSIMDTHSSIDPSMDPSMDTHSISSSMDTHTFPSMDTHQSSHQSSQQSPWLDTQPLAIAELIERLGWPPMDNPCLNTALNPATSTHSGPRCEQLTAKTWQELLTYNRPAVLTLITPAKMQVYATLIGIENRQAILSNGGQTISLPLEQLGQLWTGEFIFLWQPAQFYTGSLAENDSGPMVQWLAQQFALIDGQETQLAKRTFNAALTQRVKIFQQDNQLEADGVVGLKTLLKLHEQLAPVATLQPNTGAIELNNTAINTDGPPGER